MLWFGPDLDLAVVGSCFQNGAWNPMMWDQMILGSFIQPAVASCASFLPSVLSST